VRVPWKTPRSHVPRRTARSNLRELCFLKKAGFPCFTVLFRSKGSSEEDFVCAQTTGVSHSFGSSAKSCDAAACEDGAVRGMSRKAFSLTFSAGKLQLEAYDSVEFIYEPTVWL
jgi:hypothetical protein